MASGVLAAIFSLLSAWLLTKGTSGIPWERRSWGGRSPAELEIKRRNKWYTVAGSIAAVAAALLAVVSAVGGYLS